MKKNMKKLMAGVVLMGASSLAFANHGPAGCGLGTAYIFPDADQWWQHVLAATTNATSGNQTFGMTSGTLGCEDARGPLKVAQLFIDKNMDQLAVDAAQGEGETLAALAEILGVTGEDALTFNQVMQNNFDSLFSVEATSAATLEAMATAMAENAQLQKYLG